MIVIFKNNANPEQVKQLCAGFEAQGLKIHNSEGEHTHLIGLIGDTSSVDIDLVRANDFVEDVKRVSEPYKKANRKFHPADTAVDVAGHTIGGGSFSVIAGPCSVESEEQIVESPATSSAAARASCAAARSSPAPPPTPSRAWAPTAWSCCWRPAQATGLPIVTEIMNPTHVDLFADVDVIQVGARNMQNFELLKELGKLQTPDSPQTGPGQHHRGVADERRVHHGGRQRQRRSCANAASAPLKPHAQHPGPRGHPDAQEARATCPWSLTPATPRASPGWWSRSPWRPSPRARTE